MNKIPTLYLRDPEDMRRGTDQVNPECQWVIDGEGTATRKYDGTCVMLDEAGAWWARREVKPGKTPPPNYVPVTTDKVTGKTMGWEPIAQPSFEKFHVEAVYNDEPSEPGTYELCGPKINGNPEGFTIYRLIRHGITSIAQFYSPIENAKQMGWEGVVWHHPDGRMAKLKVRDF